MVVLARVQTAQRRLNGASLPRTQMARGTKDQGHNASVARWNKKKYYEAFHIPGNCHKQKVPQNTNNGSFIFLPRRRRVYYCPPHTAAIHTITWGFAIKGSLHIQNRRVSRSGRTLRRGPSIKGSLREQVGQDIAGARPFEYRVGAGLKHTTIWRIRLQLRT